MITTTPRTTNLSLQELIDVHQLIGYTKLMVKKGLWKENTLSLFSQLLESEADTCYKNADIPRFTVLQTEIADSLRQHDVELVTGEYISTLLQPEIMNAARTVAIVIEDKDMRNESGLLRGYEQMRRFDAVDMQIIEIKAEEWMALNKKEKEEQIAKIVQLMQKTSA